MLEVIHSYLAKDKPIYGMNVGTVGFLMNAYQRDGLMERLAKAKPITLHPLFMKATTIHGEVFTTYAINEVSLFRHTWQAAQIQITVDQVVRIEKLVCDGVLLATPAGSSAYNFSAHGPIIPLNADLLALTPISPFRPRRWRGALLPSKASVEFEVLNPSHRIVYAVADNQEVMNVKTVHTFLEKNVSFTLLFDADHQLEERIIREQFVD